MTIITTQLCGNSIFQKALKDAFVELVNKDFGKSSMADLLCHFCDRILKNGTEKLSDDEISDFLGNK
jgi:cullin 1